MREHRLFPYSTESDYIFDFENIFLTYSQSIKTNFNISVAFHQLGPEVTGDFDGLHIVIRHNQPDEVNLFLLAHLFGHCVQFNTSQHDRVMGLKDWTAENIDPEVMDAIKSYELNAGRFALKLFHQIGILELDQWLSDWVHADWKYLKYLYENGGNSETNTARIYNSVIMNKFFEKNTPLISPILIPAFTARQWENRYSF